MAMKSLETEQQISIKTIIRTWQGKLTWDLLVTQIDVELGISTTRQTLNTYTSIKQEFDLKKKELRSKPVASSDPALSYLKSDIDKAEEIIRLKAENEILKEQVGYQRAFIKDLGAIASNNPVVMNIFQQVLDKTKAAGKE